MVGLEAGRRLPRKPRPRELLPAARVLRRRATGRATLPPMRRPAATPRRTTRGASTRGPGDRHPSGGDTHRVVGKRRIPPVRLRRTGRPRRARHIVFTISWGSTRRAAGATALRGCCRAQRDRAPRLARFGGGRCSDGRRRPGHSTAGRASPLRPCRAEDVRSAPGSTSGAAAPGEVDWTAQRRACAGYAVHIAARIGARRARARSWGRYGADLVPDPGSRSAVARPRDHGVPAGSGCSRRRAEPNASSRSRRVPRARVPAGLRGGSSPGERRPGP